MQLISTWRFVDVKTTCNFLQELKFTDGIRKMRIAAIYSPIPFYLSFGPSQEPTYFPLLLTFELEQVVPCILC